MASEYCTRFIVASAASLPRTDRLSKIDPYVKVQLGGQSFRTNALDDNENPTWNFPCCMVVRGAGPGSFLTGSVSLALWDSDTFSDSHVANATLQLDSLTPDQLGRPITLPLVPTKDKYGGRASTITVRLDGLVQSFNSVNAMFGAMPGYLANRGAGQGRCYIPIQESQGLLYVGLEYEPGGEIDVKVFVTRPNVPLFLDLLILQGRQKTKVQRRIYEHGHPVVPGLVAYEELKLDDIPLTLDFNQLALVVFDSAQLGSISSNAVVSAHGWRGALSFEAAARTLHGVEIDHKEEEIYMQVDAGETMLLVDYDADDADIKLAVLAGPATADKGYDLRIKKGDYRKTSELFVPPASRLGGRLAVSRIYELDDLPYGTRFEDIEILRYRISNPRQYTIQGLTRIMG